MSAVCPSCGVAVMPGYAKCPRCQTPLPYGRGNKRLQTAAGGGTAVEDRRFPILAIAGPLGGLVLLIVLVKVCGGGDDEKVVAQVPTGSAVVGGPAVPQPQTPTGGPQANPTTTTQPTTPDPAMASAELDRALRLKRFWSTIEIAGTQVDVRSASCDDKAMPQVIDSVAGTLRGAGLTRLRCVAQSGTVVFERNL